MTADLSFTKKYFSEKTFKELGSSNFYGSFGTFCVNIGQLFESQWTFEEFLNNDSVSTVKVPDLWKSAEVISLGMQTWIGYPEMNLFGWAGN